jgi:hypothetical protein
MARTQHLPEKLFGGIGITGGAQHEVQHGAYGVNRPLEITAMLVDPDVRLVHTIRIG